MSRRLTAHLSGEAPFYRCAHRLKTKDGRWKWILDAGAVVERDPHGAPLRAVGTHVDINESKAAEALFRLVFEKSGDPQLLLDDTGVIDCNEATVRALRVASKASITGTPMRRYFPESQPDGTPSVDSATAHVQMARAAGAYRFEWTLRREDGTELPVEVSVARAAFDGRGLYLMTWHDVTHQRESERILREAKEAAEQASNLKSDFLARMSHELRSPLNSVIGFSRILQKSLSPETAPNEATYLERIHANGVHLLGLINNVLDIARIESGKVEVESIVGDVAALLRDTVHQLEGEAHGRAIVVRADVSEAPVWLATDHDKLRQVLINLVGNAIKFTPQGEVTVCLRLAADGSPLAVEVRDTGIGIPADRLAVIFDPFEQAERATTRRFGGTGLGLAISKQLCDLLGYRLSVTSELGRGSVFTVALTPASPQAP
ncbi:MAG: PAS domain S-box protein [Gemmatimonadetes bacterium]|nr:PAS domain S-box protein [Gemmatimonadota bacterium]